jgi:hypothetical protein
MINIPRVGTPKTVAVADGVSRRGAVARLAGASVVGAVGAGVGSSALASVLNPADSSLSEYRGKIAIHGGKVVSGYVTAPRGRHGLDVVVLTHGKAGYDAALENTARRFARLGKVAIVADLTASYRGAAATSHEAMVADLQSSAFDKIWMGNGNVSFVTAS